MYYYKISNLVQNNGICDYKGLDINKIIPGTQIYPHDLSNNICVLASTEDVENNDLIKINEEGYNNLKKEILSTYPEPQPSQEQLMQQSITELGQTVAQEKIKNMQKTNALNEMGQELARVKLDIIKLQGGK